MCVICLDGKDFGVCEERKARQTEHWAAHQDFTNDDHLDHRLYLAQLRRPRQCLDLYNREETPSSSNTVSILSFQSSARAGSMAQAS